MGKRYFSIRVMIFLILMASIIPTIGIVYFVQIFFLEKNLDRDARDEVNSTVKTVGYLIEQEIANGYYPGIVQKADRLLSSTEIKGLKIKLPDGYVVYEKIPEKTDATFADSIPIYLNSNENLQPTQIAEITVWIDKSKLKTTLNRLRVIILFSGLLLILASGLVVFVLGSKVTGPLRALAQAFQQGSVSGLMNFSQLVPKSKISELTALFEGIEQLAQQNKAYEQKLIESVKLTTFSNLSKQVAHDIRSPLSALSMITGTLGNIPEEKRILIRNSVQRINDIANDLLDKAKPAVETLQNGGTNLEAQTLQISFVPALVDTLVSEKRMQFREYVGLDIDVDLRKSFGAFSVIDTTALKRVLSNLINNSVEALANHQGRICISVITLIDTRQVLISVEDNGCGMTEEVIAKLGERGNTKGKTGKLSGTGLGLHHAVETINYFGGTLKANSTLGSGTTISIFLPLANCPSWFAEKIDLTNVRYLISLDDDVSIHQIWGDRLRSVQSNGIEHLRFQSGELFNEYVLENRNRTATTLFLVDYELINQIKTGLDLIEELKIHENSILVTSRYEESDIRTRASVLPLKILPKSLAGFIPFVTQKLIVKYQMVLLDDDSLTHTAWKMFATEQKKTFIGFTASADLFSQIDDIDKESLFYIDANLGGGELGEFVSKKLFDLGYKNLFLATGQDPSDFSHVTWVKGVLGKEFPKN